MGVSLFQALSVAIAVQCAVYAVFLLVKKKGLQDKILSGFLIVTIAILVNLFLRINFGFPYFYHQLLTLLAPLIYLYVKTLTNVNYKLGAKSLIHSIGFVLAILLMPLNADGSLEAELIMVLFVFLWSYVYLLMAIMELRQFHRSLQETTSNYDAYNLKWLNIEILILSIYFVGLGAEAIVPYFELEVAYPFILLLSFLSLLFFVNILTYKSLSSPVEIFQHKLAIKDQKYSGSVISEIESKELYVRLIDFMDKEKIYRDSDLYLQKLSDLIAINPPILSQVINQNARMNFNDFINQYRVNEAKKMLETDNYLIKEVMYNSGFNSTSTFNAVFKKFTGLSPSRYRQSRKNVPLL